MRCNMYRADLSFSGNHLYTCYQPEARRDGRVDVSVSGGKSNCKINIEATDPTALRAALTTITKLLAVFEKVRMI